MDSTDPDSLPMSESRLFAESPAGEHKGPPGRSSRDIWQKITVTAGLLLAATVLLPVCEGWDVSPARLWWIAIGHWFDPQTSADDHFYNLASCLAGYACGALMAGGAAARLAGWTVAAWVCSSALVIVLALVGLGLLWTGEPLREAYAPLTGEPLPVLASLAAGFGVLAYIVFAIRLGRLMFLYHQFAGSIAALAWFAFSACMPQASFGVYLSLLASLLLVAATIGETAPAARRSPLETLSRLFLCQGLRRGVARGKAREQQEEKMQS